MSNVTISLFIKKIFIYKYDKEYVFIIHCICGILLIFIKKGV